jgi:hypothetical protein
MTVDLTKKFDSPFLQGLFCWFWQQQWLQADLSCQANWLNPEADLVTLSDTQVKKAYCVCIHVCFVYPGTV